MAGNAIADGVSGDVMERKAMIASELAVAGAPLLSVRDITVRFFNLLALDRISFDIPRSVIYGLIGPNGAGKTTLFNCLSRVVPYQSGEIWMDGKALSGCPTHAIPRLGIARTFQNLAMFGSMSVVENILVGAHSRLDAGVFSSGLRFARVSAEEERIRAEVDELVRFLDLWPVRLRNVGGLPFGTQKRVELARALVQKPRLLLLDEPAAGLTHSEVAELGALISEIRSRFNLTVLLVEHHMGLVMSVSDRLAVLDFGKLIGEGVPEEVRKIPAVISAYLDTSRNG